MPIEHLDVAIIGDEELVNALRLAGISRHYMIEDDHNVRENVREALTELLAEPDVGLVMILEGYAQYVEDLMAGIRKGKGVTPVIVEVPSKLGTKYPDTREYYRQRIREAIGFEIEL